MAIRNGQLPAYRIDNAMINFQPLSSALDGYREGIGVAGKSTAQINAANAMQAGDYDRAAAYTAESGDVSGAMALRRHPGEMRAQEDAARTREVQRLAGRAQEVLAITDPAQRLAEASRLFSSDRRFEGMLREHGYDGQNPDPILRGIVSEARGYRDPGETAHRQAQTRALNAQTENAGLLTVTPGTTVIDRRTREPVYSAPPAQERTTFGPVGADRYGTQTYGFIDPKTRTVTPHSPTGGQPPAAEGVSGQAFLDTLDRPTADQIRGLAEGRIPFPTGMALRSPHWQRMVAMLSQYDPQFDAVNYNARHRTRQDFTAGRSAQNLTSFNTTIAHLDTLEQSIDGLNNSGFRSWNRLANAVSAETNPRFAAAMQKFNAARTAVTDELTRAFRGTGGNVHDIVQWERNINAADSPEALRAVVRQAVELLHGRVAAVGDQYNRGMGTTRDPVQLLSPSAQRSWRRLTGEQPGSDTVVGGQGQRTGQPPPDPQSALAEARAALQRGAPRDAVLRRLQELGVDAGGL